MAEYSQPLASTLTSARIAIAGWLFILGPASLGLGWAATHKSDRLVLAALLGLLLIGTVTAPSLLVVNAFRYLQPISVPLIVAGLANAGRLWADVLIGSALIWTLVGLPSEVQGWHRAAATFTDAQSEVASWMREHLQPGTRVLVHDAGFLSEYSSMQLVDLVGLKSPDAMVDHATLTGPSAGQLRSRAMHEIACRHQPSYVVILDAWDRSFGLLAALQQFDWKLELVFESARSNDRLGTYAVYRLGPSPRC
jgi:hypothetical protein